VSRLRSVALSVGVLVALLVTPAVAFAQVGPLPRPDTCVDGERFAGVVAPATFDPANGNFDELYMCTDGSPASSPPRPAPWTAASRSS